MRNFGKKMTILMDMLKISKKLLTIDDLVSYNECKVMNRIVTIHAKQTI